MSKLDEIEHKLDSLIAEVAGYKKNQEFQVGEWLEFSDNSNFDTTLLAKLYRVSSMEDHPFETKGGLCYYYARHPLDRIIPHDGGDIPEWVRAAKKEGKNVTAWWYKKTEDPYNSDLSDWSRATHYLVHKGEE